jgi:hypothetical protein
MKIQKKKNTMTRSFIIQLTVQFPTQLTFNFFGGSSIDDFGSGSDCSAIFFSGSVSDLSSIT